MANPTLDQSRVAFLRARTRIREISLPAWPREQKELPLVEVEVRWVRFSTLNHRTRAEQMSAITRSGSDTLFSADPLGPVAQNAQYEILCKQDGFEALKVDLKERGQQDPAVITADGVLINGNRRSAALRSLYADEDHLKARYVKCLVLPEDAGPEELVDLEAELQVARDFREDYSWINEALLIEELYERESRDFSRVASRMHRDLNDVKSMHEKLQQVHQLVDLSNGARLHLDFKDNESAFDELAKHIRSKPTLEADAVRNVYFLGTLANVNYRKLRHLRRPDAANLVVEEIERDPSLSAILSVADGSAGEAKSNTSLQSTDLLDDVLGEDDGEAAPLGSLVRLVAATRPEESVDLDGEGVAAQDILESLKSAITAAADEAEEEQRDQTAAVAPLVRADKVISDLGRALSALPKARAFKEWDESKLEVKIKEIESLLNKMREQP